MSALLSRAGLLGIAALVAVVSALVGAAPSKPNAAAGFASFWDPAWSPDGNWIAFVDRGDVPGDLYVINADGGERRQLTHSNGTQPGDLYGARTPTWAPDGSKLAFGYGYDGIYVVGADGDRLRRLVASGLNPDWSPGRRKIAYAQGGETDPLSLYVVNPDGSGRQLVGRPPDSDHSYNTPTWSPDGQRLAFTVGPAPDTGNVDTYLGVVSQYRGRVTALARGRYPVDPDWSPDGRRIVFADWSTFRRGGRLPIVAVLTLRTGAIRNVRPGWHPRWSPDGRRIAFVCAPAICVMNADGSNVHRLTGN